MSPRAAWRLEQLGFRNVYWYAGGKADWTAAGLPFEGRSSRVPRLGQHARRDIPTCRPGERLGVVRERVRRAGWNACVVVTGERVVLGVLRLAELARADDQTAEEVMRNGPSTYRPDVTVHEMLERMRASRLSTALVTTSEGVLIGMALLEELEAAHDPTRAAPAAHVGGPTRNGDGSHKKWEGRNTK